MFRLKFPKSSKKRRKSAEESLSRKNNLMGKPNVDRYIQHHKELPEGAEIKYSEIKKAYDAVVSELRTKEKRIEELEKQVADLSGVKPEKAKIRKSDALDDDDVYEDIG